MTRNKPKTKRTYEAPAVFRVRVVGDELAVAGCKSAGGPGPTTGCATGGGLPICKNAGS